VFCCKKSKQLGSRHRHVLTLWNDADPDIPILKYAPGASQGTNPSNINTAGDIAG